MENPDLLAPLLENQQSWLSFERPWCEGLLGKALWIACQEKKHCCEYQCGPVQRSLELVGHRFSPDDIGL